MKIVNSEPPMIAEIAARFPNRPKGVIYAFGDTIYNPGGFDLSPGVLAHEAMHGERQAALGPHSGSTTQWSGAEVWWRQYLEDVDFRYREELVAHAEEYRARFSQSPDRNWSVRLMFETANRLLAPFYEYPKGMRTQAEAMKDLKREIKRL